LVPKWAGAICEPPSGDAAGNAMPDALSNVSNIVQRVLSSESYAEMAREMGRSESTIRERFAREMERTATATEGARQLTLMRLDHLLYQWW
jgi:precorrin-3B methylase